MRRSGPSVAEQAVQSAMGVEDARQDFASSLAETLGRRPRQIDPRFLYDELGSRLFDAICALPWYPVTRAELGLLRRHAVAMLSGLPGRPDIVELGGGSGEKLASFIEAGGWSGGTVQLVDVSPSALETATRRLSRSGIVVRETHVASYLTGLERAVRRRSENPVLVLFLGSNIGNFDPRARQAMLSGIAAMLRPGDGLLLGTDLVKPEADLLLAYDDPLGVTAAFNRNLLRRINDELGGTFDLDGFAHRALWNAADQRIEMHLVSLRPQRAVVPGAGLDLEFGAGETIWTESSYKFDPGLVRALAAHAGFQTSSQWVEPSSPFALTLLRVEGRRASQPHPVQSTG
jgi:dimethylhistidine N-methyltransferase